MPISFHILRSRGLVYVKYEGEISIADSARAFSSYGTDPDFRPGQKQLVDLADVTGWEPDFPRLMALQAQKAEALFDPTLQTLFVYHAPTAQTRAMARWVLRSWEGLDCVVPLIIDTEAEALSVLGQPEARFSELLQSA